MVKSILFDTSTLTKTFEFQISIPPLVDKAQHKFRALFICMIGGQDYAVQGYNTTKQSKTSNTDENNTMAPLRLQTNMGLVNTEDNYFVSQIFYHFFP